MTNELLSSEDTLPVIWLPGSGGHQAPPTEDSEIIATNLDSLGGHLVMITGYNIAHYPGTIDAFDSDDNIPQGIHVLPPPNITLSIGTLSLLATLLRVRLLQSTAKQEAG